MQINLIDNYKFDGRLLFVNGVASQLRLDLATSSLILCYVDVIHAFPRRIESTEMNSIDSNPKNKYIQCFTTPSHTRLRLQRKMVRNKIKAN